MRAQRSCCLFGIGLVAVVLLSPLSAQEDEGSGLIAGRSLDYWVAQLDADQGHASEALEDLQGSDPEPRVTSLVPHVARWIGDAGLEEAAFEVLSRWQRFSVEAEPVLFREWAGRKDEPYARVRAYLALVSHFADHADDVAPHVLRLRKSRGTPENIADFNDCLEKLGWKIGALAVKEMKGRDLKSALASARWLSVTAERAESAVDAAIDGLDRPLKGKPPKQPRHDAGTEKWGAFQRAQTVYLRANDTCLHFRLQCVKLLIAGGPHQGRSKAADALLSYEADDDFYQDAHVWQFGLRILEKTDNPSCYVARLVEMLASADSVLDRPEDSPLETANSIDRSFARSLQLKVIDSLGHMGRHAKAALPALREFAQRTSSGRPDKAAADPVERAAAAILAIEADIERNP